MECSEGCVSVRGRRGVGGRGRKIEIFHFIRSDRVYLWNSENALQKQGKMPKNLFKLTALLLTHKTMDQILLLKA